MLKEFNYSKSFKYVFAICAHVYFDILLLSNLANSLVLMLTLLIVVFILIQVSIHLEEKYNIYEKLYNTVWYKVKVNKKNEGLTRLIIRPPLEVNKSTFAFKQKVFSFFTSLYDDVYWEGEFNKVKYLGDIVLIKLIYGKYIQNKSKNPVIRCGVIGNRNSVKLFVDIETGKVKILKKLIRQEFIGSKVEETKIENYKYNDYYIVQGDWRERIKTMKDNEADPFESIINRFSALESINDIELCFEIVPISRYYNCIVNQKLRNESKKEQKAGYEQTKQATYGDEGRSNLYQISIQIKYNQINNTDISSISMAWQEVDHPLGNRIVKGCIGNNHYDQSVVSEPELYSLWHIVSVGDKTEKVYEKPLTYPVDYTLVDEFALDIGLSNHPTSEDRTIGVSSWQDLTKHISILGSTGSGKSELLMNITSELSNKFNDSAMFIFDFKSDFAKKMLKRIPASRHKDIVYLEPYKRVVPMSFIDVNLPEDEASSLFVEMVEAGSSENLANSWGDRVQTHSYALDDLARAIKGIAGSKPSIRYMYKILAYIHYKKSDFRVVKNDPSYSDKTRIFASQVVSTPDSKQADLLSTIENKLYKFKQSPKLAKNIDNYNAKLNFEDCIKQHKIVVIDMAGLKRKQKYIAGLFYIKKLFEAIDKQKNIEDESQREKVIVIIDEAQQVIKKLSNEFEEAFSQFRGLNASLIIANQFSKQLPENVLLSMKTNCKTRIIMRSGASEEIEDYANDLDINDELFKTYLMNLPTGYGYIQSIKGNKTIPTTTFRSVMGNSEGWQKVYNKVVNNTVKNYFVDDCDYSFSVEDLYKKKEGNNIIIKELEESDL